MSEAKTDSWSQDFEIQDLGQWFNIFKLRILIYKMKIIMPVS